MYEQFRNEYQAHLYEVLPENEVKKAINALDLLMVKYDIVSKETSLTVYNPDEIPALLKTYIACKAIEGLSEQSLVNYGRVLKRFFATIHKPAAEINANDIRIYLYKYKETFGVTDRSLDKYRMYICTFFEWAANEGYIPTNPAKKVPRIKFETPHRQALTQIELEYLRTGCKTLRDKALIEFLYSTGARVSELCGVKKSDVNWTDNSVHLFGKGKKHRTSYINAKCEVALKSYLDSRKDDSEYLFVPEKGSADHIEKGAVEKAIKRILARCNGDIHKKVTPHILRHTFATTALNGNMPIEQVQHLLGHSNMSTTQIYIDMSEEDIQHSYKHSVI